MTPIINTMPVTTGISAARTILRLRKSRPRSKHTTTADFSLSTVYPYESIDGNMAYVDGEDYGELAPLYSVAGSLLAPVLRINGPDIPE